MAFVTFSIKITVLFNQKGYTANETSSRKDRAG